MTVGGPRAGLTDSRREMIIAMLARAQPKREIARQLNVSYNTIYRWIDENRDLEEAAEKAQRDIYHQALERIDAIAFDGDVKPTAETQFKALLRIVQVYEDKMRRQAGEVTMDGASLVLLKICEVLVAMPEARMKVIAAFTDAGDEAGLNDVGSGLFSPGTLEGELAGARSVAEERLEDNDA